MFLGAFANSDHVAGLDLAGGRVAAHTVHGEVTVSDILTGCKDSAGKTHAIDERVQTGFEQNHQVVTSRTGATVSFGIGLGELCFGNVVGETQTLLFNELLLVHRRRLLAGLAMLAGCKVTAIESLLSLLRDGESERTGYLTFWSTERGHFYLVKGSSLVNMHVGRAWRDMHSFGATYIAIKLPNFNWMSLKTARTAPRGWIIQNYEFRFRNYLNF